MTTSTAQSGSARLPLAGIKVLDFTTLPGPLASLLLAEAGADVIKVERPGGEDMRRYRIAFGEASVNFALLNRGKRSLCLDLKDGADRRRLEPYLAGTDVLIEQFRPGVMERLGFGFDRLRQINRGLIYCAITGCGQHGARRATAGHDLNYMAETGLLGLTRGGDGAPGLPPVLAADIGGGALPAVINILLALRRRDATGEGCQLDIAMADNLFTFAYWGLGAGFAAAEWPRPGRELISGGSPRYQIYRTADGQYLAVAPIEERFWQPFCEAIGLPIEQRDDAADPRCVIEAASRRIASATAAEWQQRFAGLDVCVSVVTSLQDAAAAPAFVARGLFSRHVRHGDQSLPALPVPIAANLRREASSLGYAHLGDANDEILWTKTPDP